MIATDMADHPEPAGDTLRERLSACQRAGLTGVPVPELLQYIAVIAAELDGYERPHGDVTPDTIRVVDGKARLTTSRVPHPLPTPASGCGVPLYMAPEVWGAPAGPDSDQYALACVYAELRTGQPPFRGSDILTLMRAHIEAAPDLEGCSEAERQVLTQALAKAANKRYPSCRDFARQLARAVSNGP
jgi:serine/threonine-protein kinase